MSHLKLPKWLKNHCPDLLELAEDPPANGLIYLHEYFQNFSYFILKDKQNTGLAVRNTNPIPTLHVQLHA